MSKLFVTHPGLSSARPLGNLQAKNVAVGSHSLLQRIFPTQGLNPGLLNCRWILHCLSHQGSPFVTLSYNKSYLNVVSQYPISCTHPCEMLKCLRDEMKPGSDRGIVNIARLLLIWFWLPGVDHVDGWGSWAGCGQTAWVTSLLIKAAHNLKLRNCFSVEFSI